MKIIRFRDVNKPKLDKIEVRSIRGEKEGEE